MQKISVKHFGNEHNDWLRALDFYRQELQFLKERLTEIAGKNTGKEVSGEIEHYENQFTIQRTNMDGLAHRIRENIHNISTGAVPSNGYVDTALMSMHERLRDEYMAEERAVNELRHGFNRFAAQWM